MSFKTGNQRPVSISINEHVLDWSRRFARERGMSLSQVVEQQLRKLYIENNGTFLAPGDHTPSDLFGRKDE